MTDSKNWNSSSIKIKVQCMQIDISQYYLDIKDVNKNPENERELIHHYYRDMLHSFEDNRKTMAHSLFITLSENGYLRNMRDKKLKSILNENNDS